MSGSKIPNIVWRNGWPTFRFAIDGEILWIALGVQDVDAVKSTAAALKKAIQLERLRARLELAGIRSDVAGDASVLSLYPALKAKLTALRQRADLPTLAQIETAFRADSAGRKISEKAVDAYWSYLLRIVRIVHGCDLEKARTMQAGILKPELLHDYQAAAIAEAKPRGPAAIAAAETTSFSAINQAQSIFSAAALQGRAMRELKLPDLTAFREFRPEGSTKKHRVPIDDTTLARLKEDIDNLWFSAPTRWLALALCGNLGLRRGSAVMARWSWVRRVDGRWKMFLVATDEAEPKGNEMSVEIRDDLWKDFCELRQAGSDYIVPGATFDERDAVFTANVAWLRAFGITADKPNHELRAIYAQAMVRVHGLAAAREGLGHSDEATTKVYTGGVSARAVRPL